MSSRFIGTATDLLNDLCSLIEQTRQSVASAVNASLTLMNWHVGNRIRQETLQKTRGDYGKSVITSISQKLTMDYGAGFAEKNLRKMILFAEVFPDEKIVASLMRQLT